MWQPHLWWLYFIEVYFCISCNSQNFYCWKCHFFFCLFLFCGIFPLRCHQSVFTLCVKWMPGRVLCTDSPANIPAACIIWALMKIDGEKSCQIKAVVLCARFAWESGDPLCKAWGKPLNRDPALPRLLEITVMGFLALHLADATSFF